LPDAGSLKKVTGRNEITMSSTLELCAEMEEQAAELHRAELHRAELRRKRFEALVEEAAAEGIPEIAARIRTDRPKPETDDLSDVFTKRTRTQKPGKGE